MKPNHAILLLLLPLTTGLNAKDAESRPDVQEHNAASTPSSILSDQLQEIVSSETMTRMSQAKLISSTVRIAVVTLTKGVNDPAKALKIALDLATTAAKAAPHFTEEISDAINGTPAIAHIDGASKLIKDAVQNGKNEADEPDTAFAERNSHHSQEGKQDFGGPCVDPVSPSH